MLEPLRIELTADELALLSAQLGARAVPDAGSAASADQQALAADSLQRRRLMNLSPDGSIQLDDVVGALLGTCAYPSFSIVVHQVRPHGSSEWSVHYAAELGVEQRKVGDERYVFTAYSSARQVLDRLASALEVGDQPRPAGALIALERTALEAALSAAAGSTPRDSAEALQADHVPAESSHSIAQLLASFDEIAQLSAYQYPAVGAEPLLVRQILLVRGPTGFWIFAGPMQDSDALYAAPMSGPEVHMLLTALLSLAIPA